MVSLSVSGCGIGRGLVDNSTPTAASPAPAQLSPVEKLADAAAKTNQGLITVVMRAPGLKTDTRLDPAGRKATMSMVLGDADDELLRVDLIQIDGDIYTRIPDLPERGENWMRSKVTDLPAGSPFRLLGEGDHTGAADLAGCVVTATRNSGSDFSGTLDLTRSRTVSRNLLTELGPKAKAVPFMARASRDGSLQRFTVDLPSVLPTQGKIQYDYSRMDAVDAEPPAASEVTELPRSLIDRFEV